MKTMPKIQQTQGLSLAYQSNLMGHITSSNTKLDQISSSESRPSTNFKISTKKGQHLDLGRGANNKNGNLRWYLP